METAVVTWRGREKALDELVADAEGLRCGGQALRTPSSATESKQALMRRPRRPGPNTAHAAEVPTRNQNVSVGTTVAADG